jgi:trigger factor
MKTNLENVSNLEKKLKIEVPPQTVNDEFSRAFKYLQREANIKGFRKGKAPIATIKTMYADKVKSDVVQNIIQATYWNALKEHKLIPVSMPSIDFEEIKEDSPFTFTANFEIRPEIKIQKKSGFKVEKEKLSVSDERIDSVVENVRQSNAVFQTVTDARPLANKDFAIIDFEGFVGGTPLENGSAKGHQLEIGANQFIPGFEEALVGMNVGEQKEISLKFPADYHVETLKDQPVTFKVTLNEIKQKALPELNEEFFKKIGQTDLNSLREQIKKEMEESDGQRIEQELRDKVMRLFVDANPVEAPKSLLEEQRKALVADFQNRLKSQGFNDENFEEYQQKWNDDFDKTAEFMVKSAFLIDKLAEEEKLMATDADLEEKFDEMAKKFNMEKEKIKAFYKEKDGIQRMSYQITEDKVFKYILNGSTVEEVEKTKAAT